MGTIERRSKRSERSLEALRLYLEALALRHELRAVALASHEGFLLAGAGEGYDLRELALLAAVGAECPNRVAGLFGPLPPGAAFHTSWFLVEGTPFYLGAVGDEAPFVGDAAEALERILLTAG
jgi:hypothetical protein